MNLSYFLIFVLPVIIIPVFILPHNKKIIFIYSILIGLSLPSLFIFLATIIPTFRYSFGKVFYPLYGWFITPHIELNSNERYHISFTLFLFLIFLIIFIVSFTTFSIFYIGQNPSVSKPIKKIIKIIETFALILLIYSIFFSLIASIRLIINLPDGFLSPVFDLIYKVEA